MKKLYQKEYKFILDETRPLADYYSKTGIIADIDGQQSIDKVFNDIVAALESINNNDYYKI